MTCDVQYNDNNNNNNNKKKSVFQTSFSPRTEKRETKEKKPNYVFFLMSFRLILISTNIKSTVALDELHEDQW